MSFVYLALANIGRGTAHNIFYEWDNEYNLEMLISGLEIDAVEKNEDGSWSIRKDDGEFYLYGVSEDGISGNISFLYPESEKSLRMPFEYVSLLTFNIYKQVTDEFSDMTYTNALNSISFPEFKLKVDYEDLTSSTTLEENQGMFSLKERFSFEATYYSVNEDGSGYCDLMIKELD